MKLKINNEPDYKNVMLAPKKKDAMMCWVTVPQPSNILAVDDEATEIVQKVAIPPQI